MPKILLIETSTALCSVAVSIDGNVVSSKRDASRSHASLTAVFCNETLQEASLGASDLDAVCISEGPGSYTGLRVGLSTAKGLCFGAGIRLLSVSSLDVLQAMGVRLAGQEKVNMTIPMIDARRMEVYTARYDTDGKRVTPIEAKVVDENTFLDVCPGTLFIGDGTLKCRKTIESSLGSNAGMLFIDTCPDAADMAALAEKEYAAGNFRDVAYFEPFYLKDFVATVPKKKLF